MHGRSSPPVDGPDERPARDLGEDKERDGTDRTPTKAGDNGTGRDEGSTGWATSPCRGSAACEGGARETHLSDRRGPRRGQQAHGRRGCRTESTPIGTTNLDDEQNLGADCSSENSLRARTSNGTRCRATAQSPGGPAEMSASARPAMVSPPGSHEGSPASTTATTWSADLTPERDGDGDPDTSRLPAKGARSPGNRDRAVVRTSGRRWDKAPEPARHAREQRHEGGGQVRPAPARKTTTRAQPLLYPPTRRAHPLGERKREGDVMTSQPR
jgi:hypothetical protein